jgi:hypothetical protein
MAPRFLGILYKKMLPRVSLVTCAQRNTDPHGNATCKHCYLSESLRNLEECAGGHAGFTHTGMGCLFTSISLTGGQSGNYARTAPPHQALADGRPELLCWAAALLFLNEPSICQYPPRQGSPFTYFEVSQDSFQIR